MKDDSGTRTSALCSTSTRCVRRSADGPTASVPWLTSRAGCAQQLAAVMALATLTLSVPWASTVSAIPLRDEDSAASSAREPCTVRGWVSCSSNGPWSSPLTMPEAPAARSSGVSRTPVSQVKVLSTVRDPPEIDRGQSWLPVNGRSSRARACRHSVDVRTAGVADWGDRDRVTGRWNAGGLPVAGIRPGVVVPAVGDRGTHPRVVDAVRCRHCGGHVGENRPPEHEKDR